MKTILKKAILIAPFFILFLFMGTDAKAQTDNSALDQLQQMDDTRDRSGFDGGNGSTINHDNVPADPAPVESDNSDHSDSGSSDDPGMSMILHKE